jgi:hypothetical protein
VLPTCAFSRIRRCACVELRDCFFSIARDNRWMSSRETVIDLVNRLPEDMPLAEIAREIELLAGLKGARVQARRREGG